MRPRRVRSLLGNRALVKSEPIAGHSGIWTHPSLSRAPSHIDEGQRQFRTLDQALSLELLVHLSAPSIGIRIYMSSAWLNPVGRHNSLSRARCRGIGHCDLIDGPATTHECERAGLVVALLALAVLCPHCSPGTGSAPSSHLDQCSARRFSSPVWRQLRSSLYTWSKLFPASAQSSFSHDRLPVADHPGQVRQTWQGSRGGHRSVERPHF